jgi:hypothetical protein
MATKIKLGTRPKSFSKTVEFKMLDGSTGCMEVQYKYRTRKDFAKFGDDLQATAQAASEAEIARITEAAKKGEPFKPATQEEMLEHDISMRVDYVMGAVEGWNLDEKFDRAAVEQLADELPAAVAAIVSDYRAAINEGRLGN